ncbi:unnamed protein product [Oppiella nova]|uniref:RING-type domain-containing protein n=1 Tax=Oppiella nova TaxID=334625 RepID=A0A7R9LAP3_9ACAR|nr:unnamed protein product [Oppiella nova]CAG2161655.1 unnamed protein product [Oppiella nova]
MEEGEDSRVFLECVKVGGRLRVRILSSSYYTDANCQFPRNIREENTLYSVPPEAIKLIIRPTSKYYRIDPKLITVIQNVSKRALIKKVFTDAENDECIICMSEKKYYVFSPCGHFYICKECKEGDMDKCPICRSNIRGYVPYSEMQ